MKTTLFSTRRALLAGLFLVASLPVLQGCFALVATGAASGAAMIADRRSSGSYVDDESIEWKVLNLKSKNFGDANHVNVTSYNRKVLLTGEVQNEHVRTEMQRLAASVANVRSVANELVVGPASSLTSRANDTAITAKIKSRFVASGKFHANHIKIVTEAGKVFLLGIVTRAEGEEAVELARSSTDVQGVAKVLEVVRVFEYITEAQAKAADAAGGTVESTPPEAP
ncbi:MAG: BON domain-containing protein [Azoarcus sp.]|jgi:osmotically-inducible protein OsmY|nr:BON domain-containing protein [Azoarcus sp.]